MKISFFQCVTSKFLSQIILGTAMLCTLPMNSHARPEQTLALRAIQSRSFDTHDQQKLLQNIISTLQDMGYIIERINTEIGFVDASYFANDIVEVTVTIQPKHNESIVRISARKNDLPLDNDPVFYQDFFNHLSQATFLNANQIY